MACNVFFVFSWCACWNSFCLRPSFHFYYLMFCSWALSWTLFFLNSIKFYCSWYWFFSRDWITSFFSSRIFSIYFWFCSSIYLILDSYYSTSCLYFYRKLSYFKFAWESCSFNFLIEKECSFIFLLRAWMTLSFSMINFYKNAVFLFIAELCSTFLFSLF